MFCSVEYGPTIFNYWHEGELVANFTFKLMGKSWTSIFVSYIYTCMSANIQSYNAGYCLTCNAFDAKVYIQVLRIYAQEDNSVGSIFDFS